MRLALSCCCLLLLVGCVRSFSRVSAPASQAEAPDPPQKPQIVSARKAVTAGRSGYTASVAVPVDGETYSWSVINGVFDGESEGASITFVPAAVGELILTVEAINGNPLRPRANLSIKVVAGPDEAPTIDAPPVVTEGKAGLDAFVVNPQPDQLYAWTLEVDGVSRPLNSSAASIVFDAGAVGVARLSVVAINSAGDASMLPGHADVVVETKGLRIIAGHRGSYGQADGPADDARFDDIVGLAHAANGDLYVMQSFYIDYAPEAHQTLRRIDAATHEVTTVAGVVGSIAMMDGSGASARLSFPSGLVRAGAADDFYFFDQDANGSLCSLRQAHVDAARSVAVTTVETGDCSCDLDSGDGDGLSFNSNGVFAGGADGKVYMANDYGATVFVVDPTAPSGSRLARFAGADDCSELDQIDGDRLALRFVGIKAMATLGSELFVLDYDSPTLRILRIPPSGSAIVTDVPNVAPFLDLDPTAFAVLGTQSFVVAYGTFFLRIDTNADGTPSAYTALIGSVGDNAEGGGLDGIGTAARFYEPTYLDRLDASHAYVIDQFTVRALSGLDGSAQSASVSTVAGLLWASYPAAQASSPAALARLVEARDVEVLSNGDVLVVDSEGFANPYSVIDRFSLAPSGATANTDYIGRRVVASPVDGPARVARLQDVVDMAVATSGDIYFIDDDGRRLRRADRAGLVSTLSAEYRKCPNNPGDPVNTWACRYCPQDNLHVSSVSLCGSFALAALADGSIAIADQEQGRLTIARVSSDGYFAPLVSGYGDDDLDPNDPNDFEAGFDVINGMVASPQNVLFINDAGNYKVRGFDLKDGRVFTIAGSGPGDPLLPNYNADVACAVARFKDLKKIARDSDDTLYVTDERAIHRIRSPLDPSQCRVSTLSSLDQAQGLLPGLVPRFNVLSGIAVTRTHDLLLTDLNESTLMLFRF